MILITLFIVLNAFLNREKISLVRIESQPNFKRFGIIKIVCELESQIVQFKY